MYDIIIFGGGLSGLHTYKKMVLIFGLIQNI